MNLLGRGVLFTAMSGVLYGSIGYFGSNLLAEGFSVSGLLTWRFLFSAVLLLPFVAIQLNKKDEAAVDLKILARLFFFGAIFYGVGTAFYFESSKSIGTGLAMVIFYAYPIFVVFLSFFIHKTPLSTVMLVSLLFIVAGCTLIAIGEGFSVDVKGISLAALSGLGYGAYVFCTKQTSRLVSPIIATFTVCLGGGLTFLFYSTFMEGTVPFPTSTFAWTQIVLFASVGTVLPVMFMLIGLKYISASKASIISVLEPVTTLAVGALYLGEPVAILQFVGALVILCSAIFVQLDKEESVSID